MADGMPLIVPIPPANKDDTRGPTWQWKFEGGHQVTICRRKAGSVSSHVHHGKDPSKNPERLFIAQGKVRLTIKVGEKCQEFVLVEGDSVAIPPEVLHKTEVLEDATILESRITHFDPNNPDTFPCVF